MTKMTKKEMFTQLIAIVETVEVENKDELIEGLQHEIDLLAKRGGKKGRLTATQRENEGIMETIVNALAELETPVTVTELIATGEGLEGYTNQKISALLRKLVEAGKVVKTIEKKRAYFAVA